MNSERDDEFLKEYDKMYSEEIIAEDNTTKEEDNTEVDSSEETNDIDTDEVDDNSTELEEDNTETVEDNENQSEVVTEDKETEIDYSKEYADLKEKYDKLFVPFKANGKSFTIKDTDELITLAQKGLGYNKKMEKIKPNLMLVKALENNKLTDPEELNRLIDIKNGNIDAITAHLKELNINTFDDIDLDRENTYKPSNKLVDKKQYELEEYLNEINEDEDGFAFLNDLSTNSAWDQDSKEKIVGDTTILSALYDHKKKGYYDQINSEVERQKTLGKLGNKTQLESYYLVGQQLDKEGKLTTSFGSTRENPSVNQKKILGVKTKNNSKNTLETNKKINSFQSTKTRNSLSESKDLDTLAKMSDEDILKECKKMGI